jgi:type II secretory pathway predicted ATPase ExeA
MYEAYWDLHDKPFRNTPDPCYLFFSPRHEEALARMLYAISEGHGAMMLTGEVGCGKTLLSRVLLDELDPSRYEVALVTNACLSPEEFLREILRQFGVPVEGLDKAELLGTLAERATEARRHGFHTLVVVDEAQLVRDADTMEEIRLLLNIQQDRRSALTLLLLGQPELRERVESMPQLLQRIGVRYHIGHLEEEEARRYLAHRLEIAGGRQEIFTRDAERLIVRESGGIPRRINTLADTALLVGCGARAPVVDEHIVRKALADAAH